MDGAVICEVKYCRSRGLHERFDFGRTDEQRDNINDLIKRPYRKRVVDVMPKRSFVSSGDSARVESS